MAKLSVEERENLLQVLEERFENNKHRHEEVSWGDVREKLEEKPDKLWSLHEMERTEGEPDVIGYDKEADEILFCDCSKESPKGRRSICYDREALESRKKNKPETSAIDMATEMGLEILTEAQYRELQEKGAFDLKTSSWVYTPSDIRERKGALFCDNRYGKVFLYHNGAESYYSARGFRGILRV